jgi:hypothetical protein
MLNMIHPQKTEKFCHTFSFLFSPYSREQPLNILCILQWIIYNFKPPIVYKRVQVGTCICGTKLD